MSAEAPLVVIVGPTASGKSVLGVWLAERLGGEILVCDSTQVYRNFDIGTGKLPLSEQHGIPHHLVDLVEPEEVFTAGEYRRRALEVLKALRERGRLPIITAGTGLYLRALLEGLADAPTRSEKLRTRLRGNAKRRSSAHLHQLLSRLDPQTASRIAPRDTQKVIRALEIRLLAGKPVAQVHQAGRPGLPGYRAFKVGLLPPRDELYARIERRVEAMLEAGWLEEVKCLVDKGQPQVIKPFEFIGYGELRGVLEGRLHWDEAVAQIQKATRRYAKRQITWFRAETGVRWFEGFGDSPEAQETTLTWLGEQLGGA